MLETLNTYIEPRRGRAEFILEQRPGILALSILCHLIFYTAIVLLDRWAFQQLRENSRRRGVNTELVEIAKLSGGSDRKFSLRRAPDSIDPAILKRLELDTEHADDTRLITKSPRPGVRDSGQSDSRTRTASGLDSAAGAAASKPPESRSVAPAAQTTPQPSQPANQLPMSIMPPAPRPPRDQSQRAAINDTGDRPRIATPNSGDPGELGLQRVEGQYIAAVRTKIYKSNERLMPRDWVKTTLAEKVSADFDIIVGRGGRLLDVRLVRSSGYSILDKVAREAIVTAAPFEGWPSEAVDKLPFTVTMFYTPTR
ncbi:MAG: hypothetical protein DMF61_03130 [Blastocatellia bacterium AA13]|nr:MAG: hypothetical protein DMF61_03130 [Blastocatellia bacterium AA13]